MPFDAEEYQSGQWRSAMGENLYERLELDWSEDPDTDEIQEAYLTRYRWWLAWDRALQRGGPIPPILQAIGPFIPQALKNLGEAKSTLTDDDQRENYRTDLVRELRAEWRALLEKWVSLALANGALTPAAEARIREMATEYGIPADFVDDFLAELAPPPPPTTDIEHILSYLKAKGCTYYNKIPNGGCLWVIGAKELKPVMEALKAQGILFAFTAKGGQATRHRPGWWWKP